MAKHPPAQEIVGVRKAAEYLDCSYLTIYRMLESNEFPAPHEEKILDFPSGRKIIRVWKPEQLDAIRDKLRKPGQRKK